MNWPAKILSLLLITIYFSLAPLQLFAADNPLTGKEIVERCGVKYGGDDQRSQFEVLLRDQRGNEKRSVYLRLWKDYKGVNNIIDKMLLFTEYPPDAQGAAFMRATYTPDLKKAADQWIYLPVLRKIRRVTIRDQGDSFLNSELTYADITPRAIDEDTHKLLDMRELGGMQFYVVESTPKEPRPLYSKRVQWFEKTPNWDDCSKVRIDYYDLKGNLLKEQFIKWQRVDGAWLWDRVLVRNVETQHASVFLLTDAKINTGITDDIFTERTLRMGPSAIPKLNKKSDSKDSK
jgi:Outer membrane lipoprotein-sorting protein